MSERERKIRELIDRLDGFQQRVLIDLYRHLVFAHMVASDGKRAARRLDTDYPSQGVFEPARTRTGKYEFALDSASDMVNGNIQHNDQLGGDVREALRVLLDRLVAEGILDPPSTVRPPGAHDRGSTPPLGGDVKHSRMAVRLVPYRRSSTEAAEEGVPYFVDQTERDEKTRDHMRLQNHFADFLASAGVQPLSAQGIDVDVAWLDGDSDRVVVGEVKTLNPVNEKRQIRLGLGQLLDYLDRFSEQARDARGVLVVEREPTDLRWNRLLQRHGIALVWPETYGRALESPTP